MGIPDRPQPNPYAEFNSAVLRGQHVQAEKTRLFITGLVRFNAQQVFGNLETKAMSSFKYNRRYRFTPGKSAGGEDTFNHVFAPTVAKIISDLSWNGGDRQLALFCAGLYLKLLQESIKFQEEHMMGTSQLEVLKQQIKERCIDLIASRAIPGREVSEVGLLLRIFDVPTKRRSTIHHAFTGDRTKAFDNLKELAEEGNPDIFPGEE